MKSMDKISTGIAYGTSAGSAGYWFLQLLDKVTPSQWAAIGVLGIRGRRGSGSRPVARHAVSACRTPDGAGCRSGSGGSARRPSG